LFSFILIKVHLHLKRPEKELKELKDEIIQRDDEVKQLQKESTYFTMSSGGSRGGGGSRGRYQEPRASLIRP
jgi:hypothetical protein